MRLKEAGEWFARGGHVPEAVPIAAGVAQGLPHRPPIRQRVVRYVGQATGEGAAAEGGCPERRRLLAGQRHQVDGVAGRAIKLHQGPHHFEAAHDAQRAIVAAAIGYAVEMRTNEDTRQRAVAPWARTEDIGGGVDGHVEPERAAVVAKPSPYRQIRRREDRPAHALLRRRPVAGVLFQRAPEARRFDA